MNYILDAHTHTIDEMVQEAKNKGLKLLGITEHASDMPGSCHPYYFSNLPCIKKYYNKNELIVLFGCEGNIIEENGIYTLDILRDNFTSQCVDYIIASMHKCCFPPKNKDENTKAFLDVMNTGKVNILGHIDDGNFELDYEEIIKCAKKNKVVIELNNSSNSPIGFRINAHNLDLIYYLNIIINQLFLFIHFFRYSIIYNIYNIKWILFIKIFKKEVYYLYKNM